ncbi:MAG: hypothetical protein NVSMB1_09010 [Polyangiales bacterium]
MKADVVAASQNTATGGYLLFGALVLAVVGGSLTMANRGKIGGPIMILAAAVPAYFVPTSLFVTWLIALGGALALFARKRPSQSTQPMGSQFAA